ncbi:PTS sugar transporter subunit IIA [Sporolactobacillus shoreicorticis]|uniref:PTS sugar transporter subunit IIA n=1 Tax=Sporolactobacillus shoreicorticis TaxID=1923877 RepID=A0ABW5S123_9BACL|nr:PTS sugar transporter subunit IIA [Sporolactobacillus shoreicorticis]MCO7124631.1 PTS sugar transporter subunit IIA [Sporolactobacillus shoreicorticis]
MADAEKLFDPDLIFFEDVSSFEELFQSVGSKLLEKKRVNPGYIEAMTEREKKFPTGLDLSVVNPDSLSVAIPHTEVDFCNWKGVAVARLEKPIEFHNMISPDKTVPVKYAFFILNDEKNSQTNLLSYLMGFFTTGDKVSQLNTLKTKEEIYQFITN